MVIQRWTDEMLDELASSVTEMRESISELTIAWDDSARSMAR